jgi:hypothetical protein
VAASFLLPALRFGALQHFPARIVDHSKANLAMENCKKPLHCRDFLPYAVIVAHSWPYRILYAPTVPLRIFPSGYKRRINSDFSGHCTFSSMKPLTRMLGFSLSGTQRL